MEIGRVRQWRSGRWNALLACAAVLSVFAVAGCGSSGGSSKSAGGKHAGGSFQLGADADLSGGDDVAGGLQTDGIRAAFASINSTGGVDGHKIALTVEDDAGQASTGIANVRQMVDQRHVSALVGTMDSTVASAIAPLAGSLHVPLLGTTIPGNIAAEELPDVYQALPTDTLMGNSLLSEVAALAKAGKIAAHPRVVITAFAVPSGEAWLSQAASFAKKVGVDVVGTVTAPLQPTNEDAEAAKIAALHPDAIAAEVDQTEMQELAEGLTAAGVSKSLPIVMSWFSSGPSLMSTYHWPGATGMTIMGLQSTAQDSSALTTYKSAASSAHQQWSNPNFAQGYVVAQFAAQALKDCGYPCSSTAFNTALTKARLTLGGLLFAPLAVSTAEHTAMKYVRFYRVSTSGAVSYVGPLIDTVYAGVNKY